MTSKVFVPSEGSHDYTKAAQYGELTVLLDGKVNVFASDALFKDIKNGLEQSSPDDSIILSGNMLAAAMAFHVLMDRHGKVNVLIYSFKNEEYEIRTIRRGQTAAEEVANG